jgi:uncharacterized protein YegL
MQMRVTPLAIYSLPFPSTLVDECVSRLMLQFTRVDSADFEVLGRLSPRTPIKLRGLAFRELFQWLSNSLSGVSKSKVGDVLRLPPPDTTPNGWAVIE